MLSLRPALLPGFLDWRGAALQAALHFIKSDLTLVELFQDAAALVEGWPGRRRRLFFSRFEA